jgi:wyosine [tRNA(Phe)-imidazoG37] synthetase (radical SAM superfamily)
MNERIRELAEQAGSETWSRAPMRAVTGLAFTDDNLEKFAELIVRECMRMCEVTEMSFVTHDCDVEASGAITVKQFIAEHFGVES